MSIPVAAFTSGGPATKTWAWPLTMTEKCAAVTSIAGNPGYVSRADVAYRWGTDALPGGWVFTFGKGFVWQVF